MILALLKWNIPLQKWHSHLQKQRAAHQCTALEVKVYDVNGHCKIVKILLYYDPDAPRVRITDLEGDFSWGFTLLAKIATARNKVMISGWAQSNNGIDKVEVKLDWGEYKEAYGYETWQYLLDVTDVPSFPHYHFITVKATDGEGKIVRTYLHLIVLPATENSLTFSASTFTLDFDSFKIIIYR